MSSFWKFLFAGILIIIWTIAGGYITDANVHLHGSRNKNDDFHNAYWYSFWAAFITWFLWGLLIILIFLSVIGVIALFSTGVGEVALTTESLATATTLATGKTAKVGISWGSLIFLIVALILVIVTGVLSALTASSIAKGGGVNDLQKAYHDAIIAAVMSLATSGLLLVSVFTYIYLAESRKSKVKKQAKEQEKAIGDIELMAISNIEKSQTVKQQELEAKQKALEPKENINENLVKKPNYLDYFVERKQAFSNFIEHC